MTILIIISLSALLLSTLLLALVDDGLGETIFIFVFGCFLCSILGSSFMPAIVCAGWNFFTKKQSK